MNKARTLVPLLVVCLVVSASPSPPGDRAGAIERSVPPRILEPWRADYPASTALPPGAVVYAERPEQVEMAAAALSRFEAANLDLPPVEIWMHVSASWCTGSSGKPKAGYYTVRRGRHVVSSCGTEFTLLHELSHVWDHQNLTDVDRERFLVSREADAWASDEWGRSGKEHFANVLAWALHPEHIRPSRTLPVDDRSLRSSLCAVIGRAPVGDQGLGPAGCHGME